METTEFDDKTINPFREGITARVNQLDRTLPLKRRRSSLIIILFNLRQTRSKIGLDISPDRISYEIIRMVVVLKHDNC
jgi:hypothetical protein